MDFLKNIAHAETNEIKPMESRGFREIIPKSRMSLSDARSYLEHAFKAVHEKVEGRYTSYDDRLNLTPRENTESGSWTGERGESKFTPNEADEKGIAAKEKLAEYGMDGIEYRSAEPDFSSCCEAEVKIDNMTEHRYNFKEENGEDRLGNYAQADAKCAEQWNAASRDNQNNWTAADVREWRHEEKCTWHECCDTVTMQLVPRDIHELFRHSGGVAECKARDNAMTGGGFDE